MTSHPYVEELRGDTLIYMGEGLRSDQDLRRGNLALYLHPLQKYPLYAFQRLARNVYECLGSGRVSGVSEGRALDRDNQSRRVFLFDIRLNEETHTQRTAFTAKKQQARRPRIQADPFGVPLRLSTSSSWSVAKLPRKSS